MTVKDIISYGLLFIGLVSLATWAFTGLPSRKKIKEESTINKFLLIVGIMSTAIGYLLKIQA
jgi:hypothetical protein